MADIIEAVQGLDGDQRRLVAARLWRAWWEDGCGASILTGFPGLGKTARVIRPLVARAIREGRVAVVVDVPVNPMDLDKQFTALLVEELQLSGADALAEQVGRQPSFSVALRHLLGQGALVVIDEYQRLLDPTDQRPPGGMATILHRIAKRPPDKGCLWLVSSRVLDPVWAEPFHQERLEPPSELEELERIVLTSIGTGDADQRFPADRRLEVVRRLGANPRALGFLGGLLQQHALDELLGPACNIPDVPVDPELAEQIERGLLTKAREGLSNAAGALLRELTVLREPAQWELVVAVGSHLGDVTSLTRELRARYFLDVTNRYRLHPLVREIDGPRLRQDEVAWRTAHGRAGTWYAQLLRSADRNPIDNAKLALHLDGARYHLIEAQASDELGVAMHGIQAYLEQKYGRHARRPTDDIERNAQISLLDLFLAKPGEPGMEFHLANLLKQRGGPGDLSKALPHAQRATLGSDSHEPWVLWIQIVRQVEGLDAAVSAARIAAEHVASAKNIFAVLQLLGAFLNHLGKIDEAVTVLLEGAERAKGSEARLIAEALLISAAEKSSDQLKRVHRWISSHEGYAHQLDLADVLLLEHENEWREAAKVAQRTQTSRYSYRILTQHAVLCWLGAAEPDKAQQIVDSLDWRQTSRYQRMESIWWMLSLTALHQNDSGRASELLATYLGVKQLQRDADIRSLLLYQWDHNIATMSEANPALTFPILPASITGLQANTYRPQYGPPVLPRHQGQSGQSVTLRDTRLRILAVADEWHSGRGGLSTFNRQLCLSLSSAGANVVCLVLDASAEDRQNAGEVTLVEATRTPGQLGHAALSRKPKLPEGFTPDLIIGHGRVTGPAAKIIAEDHFPSAKRLHFVHMAPDEIEWFKLDREDDAGARAEDRTQIEIDLGRTAARVVAVGPRLHNRYLRDLSVFDVPSPVRLDPGFDTKNLKPRIPPPGAPWSVLMLGRLEDENPKGLDLAAKAVGIASLQRAGQFQTIPLELLVRGARPNTSNELYDKLRAWSGFPGLKAIVRPFSTDAETLDEDIRRASLVLMPSRTEGFGLVGLEAIVAGTPVLVSSESGLGEMLRETLEPEQANRMVVPMFGDETKNSEEWGRAVNRILSDRENAFRRAAEIREDLGKRKTWSIAIARLLEQLSSGT